MKKEIILCDICYSDGEEKEAVAEYWGDENQKFHCCKKCLKLVKGNKLKFEMLKN